MRRQVLAVLLALPLAAAAQAPGRPGPGPGPGAGPMANPTVRAERMEKRMQLARTLGLAEALDLNDQQALQLRDVLAKFDQRRIPVHQQMAEARTVLARAARGEKVAPADVDGAIQRAFQAREQMNQIDRETVAAISKGLSPEQRARAVLFLARFQQRMGHGMGPGMGGGMGPGMMGGRMGGRGMGMGPGPGRGMGPGAMGGPGTCPNCPYNQQGPMMDGGGDGAEE